MKNRNIDKRRYRIESFGRGRKTREEPVKDSAANPCRDGYLRIRQRSTPPRWRFPRGLLFALVAAAVVIAAGVALAFYLNRGIGVVDLTGWSEKDAKLWADNNEIFLRIEHEYNDTMEYGIIFYQDTEKGARINKGTFIQLKSSKGHDPSVTVALPDIMNMTKDGIDAWVAQNFLQCVSVTAQYSETVPAGRVISFTVGDKSVVDKIMRNTPVYIQVSKGKEDLSNRRVTVPDFAGMTVQECSAFADSNGIKLTFDEQYNDYQPKGKIVGQSIKANDVIKAGDTVSVTVSKGKKILIPDFSQYVKQAASQAAQGLGITAVVTEKYSDTPVGKLISQSIPGGSVYNEGDTLQLVYSLGNKVVITSFVGQTRDKIETWAKGLNDQGAAIVIKARYTKNTASKDKIIYQDKVNVTVGTSATVNITVSLGKLINVPDFIAPEGSGYDVAYTYEKAMALCTQLGIIPVFVESGKSGKLPGEIWYQSVAAGKEVAEGTTITLKYNPNKVTVIVPDFTGMTKDEIIAAGYLMKLTIKFVIEDDPVEGYEGKVYQQSLTAGIHVASGTAITLTISPEAAT